MTGRRELEIMRDLLADAEAERDQLRAVVAAMHDLVQREYAVWQAMVDSFAALTEETERDRLRESIEVDRAYNLEAMRTLADERDRLRAVVAAVREHRALIARLIGEDHEPEEEIGLGEAQWASWRRITEMVDQLDVSPNGEDAGGQ